ncbi:hypothetical protein BCAR13_90010 [Paraburkholderia caribensis]|nr:hypothetical protein BCAR13_90010 [Paraburkholderia caribensis]
MTRQRSLPRALHTLIVMQYSRDLSPVDLSQALTVGLEHTAFHAAWSLFWVAEASRLEVHHVRPDPCCARRQRERADGARRGGQARKTVQRRGVCAVRRGPWPVAGRGEHAVRVRT